MPTASFFHRDRCPLCPQCGYDLRVQVQSTQSEFYIFCPECGQAHSWEEIVRRMETPPPAFGNWAVLIALTPTVAVCFMFVVERWLPYPTAFLELTIIGSLVFLFLASIYALNNERTWLRRIFNAAMVTAALALLNLLPILLVIGFLQFWIADW